MNNDLLTFEDNRKYDIILIGRAAIDFNPLDYYKTLAESSTFKKYVGGSPANIAIGLSRLKMNVGFISKVSKDRFGDFILEKFKDENIDISNITYCNNGESLGLTFTEILSENKSSILMYRNNTADLALSTDDINEEYIKSSKTILISGTALAASPSRDAILKALALAKKNNTRVIFDIDYRGYNWKSFDEIAIYYSLVAKEADIILGSREEFDLTEKFIGLSGEDKDSASYWINNNAKILIIKHGKEGSMVYSKNGDIYSIKPFNVKALKGFGGGDGYASSFLYGILKKMEINKALELATASASILVSSHSCSEDMPTIEILEDFIKKNKTEEVVKKMN